MPGSPALAHPLGSLPPLNAFPENHPGLESSNFYWSKDVEGISSTYGFANRLAYKPASHFSLKTPACEPRCGARTLPGRASEQLCTGAAGTRPGRDQDEALARPLPRRSAREPRLRIGFLL